MKLTRADLGIWKQDSITQEVFRLLEAWKGDIEETMCSTDFIMSNKSDKELAKLVGQRDVIDLVLNLEIEEDDNDNVEESKTN